jgi:hypothetical protein
MTTEQNQPQPPAENVPQAQASNQPQGQHPGHGGHRRRRRRKRNKGGAQAQGQNQPQQGQPQNQQPPQPQAQKPKHKQQQQPSSQQRFFRNGNGQQQGGGGRRRNKQRRERVFVGPMDHSYRAVNGNVADAPPSHMEYRNGNVNGNLNPNGNGFYSESAAREAPPPVRHDAPTRIYLFIEDLFFFAKINETARKLGIKVAFVKNEPETVAKILEASEEEKPSLIVFDLNNAAAKPMTLIPKLKSKLKKGTSIIGFLSHLQGDLKAKAVEAGCDTVMPRSAFSQNLPNLLRRHGLDEEEEKEYAQA